MNHIVGIVCVSDTIGSSEQHLEWNVGNLFPHLLQPLPGTLMQEPHGHIEGGAAPVLKTVKVGEIVSHEGTDLQQVMCPVRTMLALLIGQCNVFASDWLTFT